jgi:hypothetical protein
MLRRHILEGMLIFQKIIHELSRKKIDGILLNFTFKRHIMRFSGLSYSKFCERNILALNGVNG